MSGKITPCLWFDGQAEEAARFYISVFGDGSVDSVEYYPDPMPFPAPFPAGAVMLVEFTLFGQAFQALNGGPEFRFTEAISLSVACRDQAQLDGWFDALTADGGSPAPCGWVKDKYGLSWQLVPDAVAAMQRSGDRAGIARMMAAMMAGPMQKLDIAVLRAAFDGEGA